MKIGNKPGIYSTWEECQQQIRGYSGAVYKKFKTMQEANLFIDRNENDSYVKKEESQDVSQELIYAYVDGSYNPKNNTVGYGLALVKNNEVIFKDLGGFRGDSYTESRNVYGETRGALKAVELAIANGLNDICIVYDYEGIEYWAIGKWKAKKELTKDYQEFMFKYQRYINISFKKVKAHTSEQNGGDKFNALADKLAKIAVNL